MNPIPEKEHASVDGRVTVTAIRPQTRNPNRVSIFCDGEFLLGVHREVAVSSGIRVGTDLTTDLLESAQEADASYRARDAALLLLSYRPRTTAELSRRLAEKGYANNVVAAVVRDLTDEGLIDDVGFADEYVEQRVRGQRHGLVRIRTELAKKGVPPPIVEAAISRAALDADWKAAATHEARRKWGSMPNGLDLMRKKKRLHDHLVRRGFDFGLIREVMEEVAHGKS